MPIKKIGRRSKTESLIKSLKDLNKTKIQVGHFQSDGQHSSGLSYVDLMILWAIGGPDQDTIKNPLALLGNEFRILTEKPGFKQAIRRIFSLQDGGFDQVGKFIEEEYKDLFGKLHPIFMKGSPSNPENPLVDTGELRDEVKYKVKRYG